MSDFAENLKYHRKRKHLSQTELAKMINYGYTAIANYESGRNEPSIDVLVRLSEILDVTVDELVGVKMKIDEQRLLSAYKKLDDEKRKMIQEWMHTLQS